MSAKWIGMLGLIWGCFCLAAPSYAQSSEEYDDPDQAEVEPDPADEGTQGAKSARDLRRIREDMESRRGRKRRPTYNLDRLEKYMKRDLDLDDQQLAEIERLFAEQREEYYREIEEQKERSLDHRDRLREMLLQMREARDADDKEAMREVTERIRSLQDAHRIEQISEEFVALLEEQLYEEQIEPFRKLLAMGRLNREPASEAVRKNPGMLRRFVLRLDLDEEQRESLDELYGDLQEELRSGQLGPDERAEAARDFHDEVMELLSEEQKTLLTKHLGRSGRRTSPGSPVRLDRDQGHDHDDSGHDHDAHDASDAEEVEETG